MLLENPSEKNESQIYKNCWELIYDQRQLLLLTRKQSVTIMVFLCFRSLGPPEQPTAT